MVVLTAITLFGRKWLHKEKYSFDEQMHLSSSKKTEDVLASSPSEHWLLGFKDRNLEEEYLNDLADVSEGRLFLGYGMCAFYVFATDVLPMIFFIILDKDPINSEWDAQVLGDADLFAIYVTAFVAFIGGLISR